MWHGAAGCKKIVPRRTWRIFFFPGRTYCNYARTHTKKMVVFCFTSDEGGGSRFTSDDFLSALKWGHKIVGNVQKYSFDLKKCISRVRVRLASVTKEF